MNSVQPAVTSAPHHVWQYGHVGKHREYGIVTVFDIEDPDGPVSDDNARIITFINASGLIHQQRDNGRGKLGVTFTHDSGHVLNTNGVDLFVNPYVDAFKTGVFNQSVSDAPVDTAKSSSAGSVETLIEKLRVDNPSAKITAVPFADNSAQQVQMVVSAPKLKLRVAALVEHSVEELDINRSGPNAVITFTVNALQS